MEFIENTKSAIVLYVLFHCTRGECNGTRSIALLGNGIFYSISRDIVIFSIRIFYSISRKRLEFNKVLYKHVCICRLRVISIFSGKLLVSQKTRSDYNV